MACAVASACCLWSAESFAHGGTSIEEERDACSDVSLGDYCEFTDHHERLHRGTCRSFDEVLLCVRNQPFTEGAAATSHPSAEGNSAAHASSGSPLLYPAISLALALALMAAAYLVHLRRKKRNPS